MANTILVRCPVCLISQSVASDYPANKRIHCGNCGREFQFKNALPVGGDSVSAAVSVAAPSSVIQAQEVRAPHPMITWILGLILLLIVLKTARPFMATLKGPEFLVFYVVVLVAIIIAAARARARWEDSLSITLVGLIIYEAIGVLRYIDGSAAGMHKFDIMFLMMGVGGLLMFARAEHFSGNSSSSGCSSSGCGSSCSGCGGGGGCGGCGG